MHRPCFQKLTPPNCWSRSFESDDTRGSCLKLQKINICNISGQYAALKFHVRSAASKRKLPSSLSLCNSNYVNIHQMMSDVYVEPITGGTFLSFDIILELCGNMVELL